MALLLALIAVVLSATIAYSYLATQSTAVKIADNVQLQAQARAIAEAGLELALGYIQEENNWRTARPNGTWVLNEPFANGSYTIVGQDGEDTNGDGVVDGDGSLSDDPADRLTLTVTGKYNGGASIARAVVTPKIDTKDILCVVGNPASLTDVDLSRHNLLRSWEWGVTWADDDTEQSALLALAENVNAVLVCDSAAGVGTKLKTSPTGVVLEDGGLCSSFSLSTNTNSFTGADSNQINILINTHYITSTLALGPVITGTSGATVEFPGGTMATDMAILARRVGLNPRLLTTVDSGRVLVDGSAAAGRRVFEPFGRMLAEDLTSDGRTILRRALEWADASTGALSFGDSTKLAKGQKNVANKQIAVQVTLPQAGTLTSITGLVKSPIGKQVRYAIYSDSNGQVGSLLAQTSVQSMSISKLHWKRISLSSGLPLSPGTYWLAVSFDHANGVYRYATDGGQTRYNNNAAITNGFSSNWGSPTVSSTRRINLYGVYTPQITEQGGGGTAGTYYIDSESIDWR